MPVIQFSKLVIASHNAGKVREIRELLKPYAAEVVSASDAGVPEPEETGDTFAANAILKAEAVAAATGLPALADDSGLCVTALQGEPGIYSARWAGTDKNFNVAMQRVWDEVTVTDSTDYCAAFVCALALKIPGQIVQVFEGRITGQLTWPIRGQHGFGYDPMFIPDGYPLTFGEMLPADKHAISHRARAFASLIDALRG